MKEFYFIHIPKTGGSYIRFNVKRQNEGKVFYNGHSWYHKTDMMGWGSWETKAKLATMSKSADHHHLVKNRHIFSSIRNPFDLLTSYYFHNIGAMHRGWANCLNVHNINSFEQFIENYCDDNFNWHIKALHDNLFSQLYDDKGNMIANTLIRYENLIPDINKFTQEYKLAHKKTTVVNKSNLKNKDFRTYYTPKMVDMVNVKCSKILKDFNYQYEK